MSPADERRGTVPRMAESSLTDARRAWAEAGFRPKNLKVQDEQGGAVALQPADEAYSFVKVQQPVPLTKLDKIEGTGILVVLPLQSRAPGR